MTLTNLKNFIYAYLIATKKIISSGASTHFLNKIILPVFQPNRNFKRFFPHFVLQRLFLKSDAYQLKEINFAHLLAVTRKNFTSYVGNMCFFYKKIFFIFFTRIETSKVSFFPFFLLQRLVLQMWFLTTYRNLICTYYGSNQKKIYLLWRRHAFFEKKNIFFWSYSRLQTSVFHPFLHFRLFINLTQNNLKDSHLRIFWLYLEKVFFFTSGASTHFLKKKNCYFFNEIVISNVCFLFFSYFKDLFFKYNSEQLKKLSSAHVLIVTREKTPLMTLACNF